MKQDEELSGYPELRKIKKQEVYQAPDGYFDALGSQLSDRIGQPRKYGVRFLKPALITGFFAVILAGVLLFWQRPETQLLEVPDYTMLIESGYVYELDESLLTAEFSTMFHDAPAEADALEDYLIDQTDETSLRSHL